MSAALTSHATWRRILLVGVTALVGLLAVSFSAPQEAQAFRNPTTVLPSHIGWIYVRSTGQVVCPAIYPVPAYCNNPQSVTAWRWDGALWSNAALAGGEQIYAYPYTGAWHWAWTQRTGWLAVQTAQLETGYRCTGYACPVF